jgi:hypothetical protein
MTVCRRAVASWKPQSVGFSGLDRVGTRKTGVKVPPPTRLKALVRAYAGAAECVVC